MARLSRCVPSLLLATLVIASLLAGPVLAQAPAAGAPAAAAPAPVPEAGQSTGNPEEPTLQERRLVAYVATGVSVTSLATGIVFGVLAQQEYACISDVVTCNKGLKNKIVGEELFDARAEVEQKSLIADMAYLFAAASAVVAVVGYLRGFVFVDEPAESTDSAPAAPPAAPAPAPAPAPAAAAPAPAGASR
jgi:pyruvate dehydrogenase E2 component (dihydrolipoamide acetyltransferase)